MARGRGRMGSCTRGRCQAGRYMQEAWPVMGNLGGEGRRGGGGGHAEAKRGANRSPKGGRRLGGGEERREGEKRCSRGGGGKRHRSAKLHTLFAFSSSSSSLYSSAAPSPKSSPHILASSFCMIALAGFYDTFCLEKYSVLAAPSSVILGRCKGFIMRLLLAR